MKHAAVAYWLARDARAASGALELDPESLHALAVRRMRASLVDAQRSPFHDSRMRAAGLSRPQALRDDELPRALQSLSPVTKHELREAGAAALRNGRASASWFSSQSSGSSGEPFRVYYDARAWSMLKYLVKMRSRRAAGVGLGDRIAILDAIPIAAERHAMLERAGRVRRISVFRAPGEIAALLAHYRPDAIYALPSALLEVVRAMAMSGAPRVRGRRIFTSGELLTGAARRSIASAFEGALFDVYGTSETKEIAWECAAGSRHINVDVVHVEILDEHGAAVPSGVEGEIVVTLLVNRAMPLVRYRTGDRGALLASLCSCGRRGPLLGVVSGREADVLELPDGSTRSPYQLTMALEKISGLAQYQIVQAQRDLLWVNAVPADGASAQHSTLECAIQNALRSELPNDVAVEVSIVERLTRGSREKVRAVHPLPRSGQRRSRARSCAGSAEVSTDARHLQSAWAIRTHSSASRAEVLRFRDRQLRRIVQHAYLHVPYYRALFDERGVHPDAIRSAADMTLLPAITKTHFRSVPEIERVAVGFHPEMLIPTSSSGSSGRPFMIRRSWMENQVLYLARLRAMRSYGIKRSDRALSILNPKQHDARDNKFIGRALARLGLMTPRKRLSIHLDVETMAAEARAFRPAVLSGYPNMLARVSDLLQREPVSPPSIRVALVGAEALTPDLRRKIESRLGVPVRDQYGSNECNLMAWECPEGGPLHTSDDTVLVEILDPDGVPVAPGERGEVVVTALHSFTMPLIRFRLGDLAEQGSAQCKCGAPFGTIHGVQGRMLDMFPLPDGRVIHPYYLSESLIMDDPDWIENFQITQERLDHVTMRIVPREVPSPERIAELRAHGAELLGAGVEFELLVVDSIPSDVSGKYRPARSLVTSSYDDVAVPT